MTDTAGFRVDQMVEVISEGKMRRIVAIFGDEAICRRLSDGDAKRFPLTDLRPENRGPLRVIF